MTQDQLFLLLLKIAIPLAILSFLTWVAVYTRLQPWWRDHIGVNLVLNVVISVGQLSFLGLAVYFHLSRIDNRLIGWLYTIFTLAITPLMIWRSIVWIRESRKAAETGTTVHPEREPDQAVGSGGSPGGDLFT